MPGQVRVLLVALYKPREALNRTPVRFPILREIEEAVAEAEFDLPEKSAVIEFTKLRDQVSAFFQVFRVASASRRSAAEVESTHGCPPGRISLFRTRHSRKRTIQCSHVLVSTHQCQGECHLQQGVDFHIRQSIVNCPSSQNFVGLERAWVEGCRVD